MNRILFFVLIYFIPLHRILCQDDPSTPDVDKADLEVVGEEEYYPIINMPVPEDILLEVGGMATLPDGRLALATRRGEVYIVENPSSYQNGKSTFTIFASGLHEPLGCTYKDGSLYIAQRGELTKLTDEDGDGRADNYETLYAWPLSGHYHEYSYGPAMDKEGNFYVTANVAFGTDEWWRGESKVPYRGWTMRITPQGKMEPWATGMRSPCGFGMIDNDFFYNDNQGDWIGSGGLWHVKKGSFTGHPAGLRWTNESWSPLKLNTDQLYSIVDPLRNKNQFGAYIKPENDDQRPYTTLYEARQKYNEVQLPAVWLPHGILGISNSEIKVDKTKGGFGPFAEQIFVGDQGQSKIMRVYMEKVNGEYQGAAFDFRNGFQSGVLRMDWAHDGSLYVGETNRGWGSAGEKNEGLQRVIWTGKMPFEMKEVRSKPDGFEIIFTKPADINTLKDLSSYYGSSFIYKYYSVYGSPPVRKKDLMISGVKPAPDGMSVRLIVDNLTQYHIHELKLDGVKSQDGKPLLHQTAYYTLNNIAPGDKLPVNEITRYSSATIKESSTPKNKTRVEASKKTSTKVEASTKITHEEVAPLLKKYTCLACHNQDKKQIGPSYKEIAKRKYTNEKIVQLIWKPNPSNWPGYATEMAPMPQVKKEDGLKIAAWINSLK